MALQLTPYLMLNGNAKEAVHFYEKALGGQLVFFQTFGEMPPNPDFPIPAEARERVMHASLKVGDSHLLFSDTFPGSDHKRGEQVTICITSSDAARSKEIFDALREGGQVQMPLQETFFSPAYGMVTDKFGIPFQIYTEGKATAQAQP